MEIGKEHKQTVVGVIPEGWKTDKLGNICSIIKGSLITESTRNQGDIPVIAGGKTIAYYHDKPNRNGKTITISGSGASAGYVSFHDYPIFASDCSTINESNKYNLEFIYYNLKLIQSGIYKMQTGGAQPHIHPRDLNPLEILLPPLTEQTSIATALSNIDELIAQTEKLIDKKKAIKQGVMQELLKPKDGWAKVTLGNVISVSRGGSPRPIQSYITSDPSGINWIKIGDTDIESKYIQSANEKITSEGALNSRKVYAGDFILSNSMSFGRPYILNIDGCIHDGWLVLQNYQHHFDRDFLYYFLMSSYVLDQYLRLAAGSSVLNLNKEIVKGVNLFMPKNLNEQRSIANILTSIDEDLDLRIKKLTKLKFQKQAMMQVLLTGKIRLL